MPWERTIRLVEDDASTLFGCFELATATQSPTNWFSTSHSGVGDNDGCIGMKGRELDAEALSAGMNGGRKGRGEGES